MLCGATQAASGAWQKFHGHKKGTKVTEVKKTDKHILRLLVLSYLEPSRSSVLRFLRIFVAGDLLPPSTISCARQKLSYGKAADLR